MEALGRPAVADEEPKTTKKMMWKAVGERREEHHC